MKVDFNEKKCHYKEVKIGIATSSMSWKVKVSDEKNLNLEGTVLPF